MGEISTHFWKFWKIGPIFRRKSGPTLTLSENFRKFQYLADGRKIGKKPDFAAFFLRFSLKCAIFDLLRMLHFQREKSAPNLAFFLHGLFCRKNSSSIRAKTRQLFTEHFKPIFDFFWIFLGHRIFPKMGTSLNILNS